MSSVTRNCFAQSEKMHKAKRHRSIKKNLQIKWTFSMTYEVNCIIPYFKWGQLNYEHKFGVDLEDQLNSRKIPKT